MARLHSTAPTKEYAVLVAIAKKGQSKEKTQEYLDELAFLARNLGIECQQTFVQNLDLPDKRTFVGSGKLDEIKTYAIASETDIVIFDDDLTPSQLRNLEKEFNIKIYDRSLLILDIFLKRARTAQAKTQVELARNQYLMPRLTRMWTHLERQRGGTGTMGGAGEKEIETDRRIVRNQISVLQKKLEKIDKQSQTRRKSREQIVRLALVGYTNVGKSTIMRVLSKEQVYTKDELFATVDSTVRKVVLNNIPFLLSDTVGFIRKLPHNLVESFKSTLDEVREADVLIHVVDVSHPSYEEHMQVVNETLKEIGAGDKETIIVYNKVDKISLEAGEGEDPSELVQKIIYSKNKSEELFVSATEKENMEGLRSKIYSYARKAHLRIYPNYLSPEVF